MVRLGLDAATWAHLSELLDTALDLPAHQRGAWLAALDPRHEPLKALLRRLLARAAELETSDFLEVLPAVDLAPAASPSDPASDSRVGPYRLVRELGRGGMGIVWLAERADGLFTRPVALKFPQGPWMRDGLRERMARERELLAALEHPGIARLYDAGVTDAGVPYLALEHVDGVPLDEYCRSRHLGVPQRLALFLQVTDAVAHAHTALIIHRDLKPSNILVTSSGQVRLLDFGIGKLLGEAAPAGGAVTDVAGRAFTPDYASPEQIAGQPLTVATDVYSLGVVLYELLTEHRPYRLKRDSRGALEDAILETQPRAPSQVVAPGPLRRSLSGDLDAVILKTLKKAPEERYPTVAALADDLRRHLAGRPVAARPDSRGYRLGRFLARHKLSSAATAAAAVAIVTGAGAAAWQAHEARDQAERAETVSRFVTSIFEGINPALLGADRPVTAADMLDRAQQRVVTELRDRPTLQLQLQEVIARSYLGLHEHRRARDLLAVALPRAEGMAEPETVRSLHLLMAQALLDLAELDEAERHLNVFLESEQSPADASSVAARIIQSGIAYQRGQYEAAAAAAVQAVALAERLPGLTPDLPVAAYAAVGKAAGMQRQTERSLEYTRRAFERALAAFSGDHQHPAVLEHEHNYAASLIDVGRIDEALPHLERSLAAARATYGENSLVAGQYAVRLGLVLLERGRLDTAIDLVSSGIRIEDAFETGASPAKAGRRRTLARAYLAARRMEQAAGEIDRAVEAMGAIDAPAMMRVLEADRAFMHAAATGAVIPSVARLRQIVDAQDQGEPRYKTHLPDIYLGVLHLWQERPDEAVAHLERGVALARAQTRTSDLGEALTFLGAARLAGADVDEAEAALCEGLTLLGGTHEVATPVQAEAWLGLGRVALEGGDLATALDLLKRADAFWTRFAAQSRGAGEVAFWLGRARTAASQPAAAIAFERAAALLAKSPLPADATLARLARRLRRSSSTPDASAMSASDPGSGTATGPPDPPPGSPAGSPAAGGVCPKRTLSMPMLSCCVPARLL